MFAKSFDMILELNINESERSPSWAIQFVVLYFDSIMLYSCWTSSYPPSGSWTLIRLGLMIWTSDDRSDGNEEKWIQFLSIKSCLASLYRWRSVLRASFIVHFAKSILTTMSSAFSFRNWRRSLQQKIRIGETIHCFSLTEPNIRLAKNRLDIWSSSASKSVYLHHIVIQVRQSNTHLHNWRQWT